MAIVLNLLPAGTYIVAISGGVDSMALLDVLRQQPHVRLIAAHVNHGARHDSDIDQQLVVAFCKSHNIECVVKKLNLGRGVSEEAARKARYDFLRFCRIEHNARAIITAHHQDDLIETALINLLRGTGWRGLAPFINSPDILRPLTDVSKQALKDYAAAAKLPWHEDSTNTDERYLRNYVRHTLIPLMNKRNDEWRGYFLRLIRNQQTLRRTIEGELGKNLKDYASIGTPPGAILPRYAWIMLPAPEGYELFQALSRTLLGNSLVRELALQALLFARVARPGKVMLLGNSWQLRATQSQIIVEPRRAVVS